MTASVASPEWAFETLRVRVNGAVLHVEIAAPPMNLLGPELVRDLVAFAGTGWEVMIRESGSRVDADVWKGAKHVRNGAAGAPCARTTSSHAEGDRNLRSGVRGSGCLRARAGGDRLGVPAAVAEVAAAVVGRHRELPLDGRG